MTKHHTNSSDCFAVSVPCEMQVIPARARRGTPTACVWWQPCCGEVQFGILGTSLGELCIVELREGREVGGCCYFYFFIDRFDLSSHYISWKLFWQAFYYLSIRIKFVNVIWFVSFTIINVWMFEVGGTYITRPVKRLQVCTDNYMCCIYLLITSDTGEQFYLLLEHRYIHH